MLTIEFLGFIGAAVIVIAYIPQIRHIVNEHCAGGVSQRAWVLWLIANILLFFYAMSIQDLVFIVLQAVNIVAIIVILILIRIYGKRVCHSKEPSKKRKHK